MLYARIYIELTETCAFQFVHLPFPIFVSKSHKDKKFTFDRGETGH